MKRLFYLFALVAAMACLSSCETMDMAVVHPSVVYIGGYPYYASSYYHYYDYYYYYYYVPRGTYRHTPPPSKRGQSTPRTHTRVRR